MGSFFAALSCRWSPNTRNCAFSKSSRFCNNWVALEDVIVAACAFRPDNEFPVEASLGFKTSVGADVEFKLLGASVTGWVAIGGVIG